MKKIPTRFKVWFVIILTLLFTVAATFYVGIVNSLMGAFLGVCFFSISYLIKFGGETKTDLKKEWMSLIPFALLILAMVFAWFSSLSMLFNGIEKQGIITKVSGYECTVNNFHWKVTCDNNRKVGDTIKYLYSPQAIGRFAGKPPIMMKENETRFDAILSDAGSVFFASLLYGFLLFTAWFISLFMNGILLLQNKLSTEPVQITKIGYSLLYALSYSTFVLFVIGFFKNIYNLIPLSFLNIAVVTAALLIILISDWGERLFRFSTNVMLELRSYRLIVWIKQSIKIVGYLSFALLLYESITTADKSIFDLIIGFFKQHFDLS